MKEILDEPQLGGTADKGSFEAGGASLAPARCRDADGLPQRDTLRLPFQLVRAGVRVGDRRLGRSLRHVTDQDGAGTGSGLDPGCSVDEVARDHSLSLGAQCHGGLAGEHAGAGLERVCQRRDGIDEVECGADCAFGVVLVRDRRAPDGHHGVADEFLDRAAVALDDLPCGVEVVREELARVLRVAALRRGREADEVGEQDGDEAALGRRSRCHSSRTGGTRGGAQARPTLPAEPLAGLVRGATGRAAVRERRAALGAELAAFAVLGAAAGAGHARASAMTPTRSSHGFASSRSNSSRASVRGASASSVRFCAASHSACSSSVTAR